MNDNQTNYTQHYMIEFSQALNLIINSSSQLSPKVVSVAEAKGRVLAKDIASPGNVPEFNNSAMDGYAVNSSDLKNASTENPTCLQLMGITAAGETHQIDSNTEGMAWKIMTGAPVPDGFDSIIPVENTKLQGKQVTCFSAPFKGAHIRALGEDFSEGETILKQGQIVNNNSIMALAALGIDKISVFPEIKTAIFSTGKELVDDVSKPLKPGQIRNSNKPYVMEWLKQLPVKIIDGGTNLDDAEKFTQDLQTQLESKTQIIISSGAVSMGDFDFIPQTIKKLGGKIIFHKSKIKPGKPILFAKFPNGSYYFGLPGNPISANIGLRFFVSQLIRNLLGMHQEQPIKAILKTDYQKKANFRLILKGAGAINRQAQLEAKILDGQESFKIKPLLAANGWIILTEGQTQFSAGELVDFYPSSLYWE